MAKIEFQELSFEENDDKIRFYFLDNYFFDVDKTEISEIGKFKVNKNSFDFDCDENKARKKLNLIISKGFENLKNRFNNKKTIYIHKNMNIPLIGLNYFGIVDRNTSLIEVKPLTGCNFNCIYCSVDEGISSKKQVDFVIEKDFLVEELKKLIKQKSCDKLEVYINPHGEPLLYKPLGSLIRDISDIKEVKKISLNTNGLLLNKEKVDELIDSGLKKFNVSVNSIDDKTAKKMAGINYDPKKIIEICGYISSKAELVIAPVWLPGYNDDEMPKLIEFSKEIKAKIGIQNFLNYKFGRNPCKQMSFEEFFKKIKEFEQKYDIKLIFDASDFNITPTDKIEKPFNKDEKIQAQILFEGRLKNEKIAFSKNRLISVPDCFKTGKIKLKVVRSKHNIFVGVLA
jgi:uncharacterized Fe-S cluster-containing radical SAM superfamily enzyme